MVADRIDAYAEKLIRIKVKQLIGQYGFTKSDREELIAELTADLLQHLPQYNPTKARRNTFVDRVVEHKVATLLRRRTAQRRDCQLNGVSLNEPAKSKSGEKAERGELITEDEGRRRTAQDVRSATDAVDLMLDAKQFLAGLPDYLRGLSKHLMAGHSITKIAAGMGVSRTTIHTWLKELRQLAKNAGLREYLLRN